MRSRALLGLEAHDVLITAGDLAPPEKFKIEGLQGKEHEKECRIRVLAALASVGLAGSPLPSITVEGLPKMARTTHLDLAIFAAVAEALGRLTLPMPAEKIRIIGELSLSGEVRPVRGVGPMIHKLPLGHTAIVPFENGAESDWFDAFKVRSVRDLLDGKLEATHPETREPLKQQGGIVLIGPPGSPKTIHAREIAASLGFTRSAELDAIYSVAGILPPSGSVQRIPFRAPHHSVSTAGMVGSTNKPGEVSLAHGGVLYLDEITEFRSEVLEATFRGIRCETLHGFPASPALVIGSSTNVPRLGVICEKFGLTVIGIERVSIVRVGDEPGRKSWNP